MAGRVQRLAYDADLAVHHSGRADHVDPGLGLGHRHLGVAEQGRVVVDAAVGGQHAAVAVRGELVQAQVAHHHGGVADLGDHVADRDVEDAVRVGAAGADLVLVLRARRTA